MVERGTRRTHCDLRVLPLKAVRATIAKWLYGHIYEDDLRAGRGDLLSLVGGEEMWGAEKRDNVS